jgi:hypothetical protein
VTCEVARNDLANDIRKVPPLDLANDIRRGALHGLATTSARSRAMASQTTREVAPHDLANDIRKVALHGLATTSAGARAMASMDPIRAGAGSVRRSREGDPTPPATTSKQSPVAREPIRARETRDLAGNEPCERDPHRPAQ